MRPTDGRDQWLVITRWRDEDAFVAWTSSPAFAHGHRGAGEGSAGRPVAAHSELWSDEPVDLSARPMATTCLNPPPPPRLDAVDLGEALRDTGAVREFDPAPIPDDVVFRLLDTARFAPSGGNRQGWRVIAVQDQAVRALAAGPVPHGLVRVSGPVRGGTGARGPRYRPGRRSSRPGRRPGPRSHRGPPAPGAWPNTSTRRRSCFSSSSTSPSWPRSIATCRATPLPAGHRSTPFVWSILLAARQEDLRGVVTTMPIPCVVEVRRLFAIPEHFAAAALVALGRPTAAPRRLRRRPVAEFARLDRFDGPPLTR